MKDFEKDELIAKITSAFTVLGILHLIFSFINGKLIIFDKTVLTSSEAFWSGIGFIILALIIFFGSLFIECLKEWVN